MTDLAARVLSANLGQTHIFSVGQAGFIFKSKKGTLICVDVYLSNCGERIEGHIGFKRLQPICLHPSEIIFDAIIATHPHFDHFDMDSIPEMMSNKKTKLFASVNCETETNRLMMEQDNISYMKPGDSFKVDDIEIFCVPCDHGTGAPDAFGVVIKIDGKSIYIAGDTCLRLDNADIVNKLVDQLDVLIAPINGAYGNLNEEECARLSSYLNPRLTIPCHYGMFASHGGNPGKFMEYMNTKVKCNEYVLMCIGEQLILE